MAYKKVGCIEQIFYMLKWRLKNGSPKKYPKIKAIYVDKVKRRDWKYDRTTGEIEFKSAVPEGADMKIVFRVSGQKPKNRGDSVDGKRTE